MTRTFLILGSQGQLGSELRFQLDQGQGPASSNISYIQADIDECDLTDEMAVRTFFADHSSVDVVFNAAAYTAVDMAEKHRDQAMRINALAAGNVAAASREIGARLIHISTDFVFGDGHDRPINETARPQPLSVYGKTKLAGEELALQNNADTAVLRTSGLYSRWGKNFVASIAQYARKMGHLEVVDDQFVSPTSVTPLAKVALAMAEAPLFVGGVYHATAHDECTWFDFAERIIEILGIDATIAPTTAEEWDAPARRPEYGVLDNHRLRLRGLDLFRPWDEELEIFLSQFGAELEE